MTESECAAADAGIEEVEVDLAMVEGALTVLIEELGGDQWTMKELVLGALLEVMEAPGRCIVLLQFSHLVNPAANAARILSNRPVCDDDNQTEWRHILLSKGFLYELQREQKQLIAFTRSDYSDYLKNSLTSNSP